MYLRNLRSGWKLSWSIFFSIMLIVGWTITSSQAEHCKGKHKKDPGCDGSGEPPVTAMEQEIVTVQSSGRGGKRRNKIVVMNADGTDVQVVLEGERYAVFRDVSWSGDGSKVLFHGEVNGQTGIHWVQVFELDVDGNRMNFAPDDPQFVTTTINVVPNSRWSPTTAPGGREWIVFWDPDPVSGVWDIWLVDPNLPNQKINLTQDTERDNYHPTWSPDAGRIAFLSVPGEESCSCPGDVEILHLVVDSNETTPKVQERVSLILENPNTGPELDVLKALVANTLFWDTDWSNMNNSEWIVATINADSQLWVFPTNPSDVTSYAKAITTEPDVRYSRPVWSPSDDALLYGRWGVTGRGGGICNINDSNHDNPGENVVAPLEPDPPSEIDSVAICDATPIEEIVSWYEWWRGGDGLPPPPTP